jgi:hypothetical protein
MRSRSVVECRSWNRGAQVLATETSTRWIVLLIGVAGDWSQVPDTSPTRLSRREILRFYRLQPPIFVHELYEGVCPSRQYLCVR